MVPASPGRAPAARGVGRAARTPAGEETSMRELADFLKSSEPPPDMSMGRTRGYESPPTAKKEEGGFKGIFSRKKKGAGYA